MTKSRKPRVRFVRDGKRCEVHLDPAHIETLREHDADLSYWLDAARGHCASDEEAARAACMSVGDWRRAIITTAMGRSVLVWQSRRAHDAAFAWRQQVDAKRTHTVPS